MNEGRSLAKRVEEYTYQRDRLRALLGIEVVDVAPGYAQVTLTVDEKHLNAAGVCHGGVIFSCLVYTSPSPRDLSTSRMPSSA